jgi:acetyltransferase-like isoleucine patch superfamily enzyme
MMDPIAKIYDNVILGDNVIIEDFVVLGKPPIDKKNGELKTVIGDNSLIRSNSVIYAGNKIGNNFQTGHGILLRENNKIADNVTVGSHSVVEGHCEIQNGVTIHSDCFIGENTLIEENVWIGPKCITLLTPHPRCEYKKNCNQGPIIRKLAVVGAGTIILPGVEIGECSLIGAGSIVTKDIPPNVVAYGNPAKVIKKIDEIECKVGLSYKRRL